MNQIKELLLAAIDSGEVVRIKYNGGSQPGSIRDIYPISVVRDDVVARCLATGAGKQFKLSKMELSQPGDCVYIPGKKAVGPASLREALESHRNDIEGRGWIFAINDCDAGVYRRFKNGKPRKQCEISISYREFSCGNMEFDESGNLVDIITPSTRPWHVSSPTQSTSFKSLIAAVDRFLLKIDEAPSPQI